LGQVRLKYCRLPIRVPPILAFRLMELAREEGWQLADFVRVLICLAACPSFLTLEGPERLDVIKAKNVLGRLVSILDSTSIESRPYAVRVNSGTRPLVVHVPVQVAQLIRNYAEIVGRSRNEVCSELLTQGLLLYHRGRQALLRTQVEIAKQRARDELTAKRETKPSNMARDQQLPNPLENDIK
jgi:hypothetical protein